MAQQSKIQWTDATWNPWHGCTKVSPGCKFCYMYRDKERYGMDPKQVAKSKTTFNAPLKWAREIREGWGKFNYQQPPPNPDDMPFAGMKVFTCSWSDFFIEDADEWRPDAWDIIRRTPELTYQILTKRPERISRCLPPDWGKGYGNVWLGVSIESQAQIDRMSWLYSVPAKTKFLSLEPLIGPINLYMPMTDYPTFDDPGRGGEPVLWYMDWVIIGGESGNETGKYRYRPCEVEWIEQIISDCNNEHARIPVFVKQLGTHLAKKNGHKDRHGGNIEEWPKHMQVREMPNATL